MLMYRVVLSLDGVHGMYGSDWVGDSDGVGDVDCGCDCGSSSGGGGRDVDTNGML